MATRVDWDLWRIKYVSGPDTLSLDELSKEPGAPSLSTLKKKSASDSWSEQRDRFRNQKETIANHDATVVAASVEVKKIIDTAEMITRHAQLTKLMGSIAQHELVELRKKQLKGEPTGLKPDDALKLARAAIADERLTEGLATQRQEIDLSGLSDAELEKIANGGV